MFSATDCCMGIATAAGPADWIAIGDIGYAREANSSIDGSLGAQIAVIEPPPPGTCSVSLPSGYPRGPGTPIYEVPGHDPNTMVALTPGSIYTVRSRPGATRASDLFDLSAPLIAIGVLGTPPAIQTRDPSVIKRLVDLFEPSPVIGPPQHQQDFGRQLTFFFADGVTISRELKGDVYDGAVRVPPAFLELLAELPLV
jgi:hypothetical protein